MDEARKCSALKRIKKNVPKINFKSIRTSFELEAYNLLSKPLNKNLLNKDKKYLKRSDFKEEFKYLKESELKQGKVVFDVENFTMFKLCKKERSYINNKTRVQNLKQVKPKQKYDISLPFTISPSSTAVDSNATPAKHYFDFQKFELSEPFIGNNSEEHEINEPKSNINQTVLKRLSLYSPAMSEFRINHYIKKQKIKERNERDFFIKETKQNNILLQEKAEKQDNVVFGNLDLEKQKTTIREFLGSKKNQLNRNSEISDNYLQEFESKTNYHSDVFLVPHIKNKIFNNYDASKYSIMEADNLSEAQQHRNKRLEYLKLGNSIDKHVHIYLNSLKIKYQQERDLLEEDCRKNKLKEFDDKIGSTFARFYRQAENDVKTLLDAELKDYLVFKYDRYNKIEFAFEKYNSKHNYVKENILKEEKVSKNILKFGGFLQNIIDKISTQTLS